MMTMTTMKILPVVIGRSEGPEHYEEKTKKNQLSIDVEMPGKSTHALAAASIL